MIKKKIWIVDAFTDQPFKGNPAAVMIVKDFFADSDCQTVAAEMNLSETAFIKPLQENHFHLRWFTPTVEVNLCGHATLAAAHILYQEGKVKNQPIVFDSLSGRLQVTQEKEGLQLDFPLQKIGSVLNKSIFEAALSLKGEIVNAVQAQDCIIIELKTEQQVRDLKPDFLLLSQVDTSGVIVTALSKEYDFVSRCFFPRDGINEDPVTGSAHCKLAHYWGEKLGKKQLNAYQASKRGGKIAINIVGDRVFLLGQAVTVLTGDWLV